MRASVTLVASGIMVAAGLTAQSVGAQTAAAPSAAGEWDASYESPGGPRMFKVLIALKGAELSGTVRREAGDSPLAGTVKGDSVFFTYAIRYNDNPLDMSVKARMTGDTMKGTVSFGGQAEEAFEAKRAVKRPDVP